MLADPRPPAAAASESLSRAMRCSMGGSSVSPRSANAQKRLRPHVAEGVGHAEALDAPQVWPRLLEAQGLRHLAGCGVKAALDHLAIVHAAAQLLPSLLLREDPASVFRPGRRQEVDAVVVDALPPQAVVILARQGLGHRFGVGLVKNAGLAQFDRDFPPLVRRCPVQGQFRLQNAADHRAGRSSDACR